jgi:hypothetical protein
MDDGVWGNFVNERMVENERCGVHRDDDDDQECQKAGVEERAGGLGGRGVNSGVGNASSAARGATT